MTNSPDLSIALLPLDERPVNTRYPQMLGKIAGADVLLPPRDLRGSGRKPADASGVERWLAGVASRESGGGVDGVVASIEYFLFGNLIASRTSSESVTDVLGRLQSLEPIGASGRTPVFAFGLITRVPNANDCVEEPAYWCDWGTRLFRYSQLLHKREAGELEGGEADDLLALKAELPPGVVQDWLGRRLRNHAVSLALVDLLARGRLRFLLLTSDDTSVWGLPTREKAWIEGWQRLLGPAVGERLLIHPGADEVGSALVARLVCEKRNLRPSVCPVYAVPGGEEIVAPYEDRPVRVTVEGQIRACGAILAATPDQADIVLGVLPPSPRRTEFRADFADAERREREPFYRACFDALGALQKAGKPVALGDVAYPNGADPLAMELLLDPAGPLDPSRFCAFGAWNTAGNTLGVVVAQAVCSLMIGGDPARQRAQAAFLAHRFLEDWGYQSIVRREARTYLTARFGRRDPDPDDEEQVAEAGRVIEEHLAHRLAQLQARGVGTGFALAPGSVRLPWRRTFEVDFDLAG